MPSFEYIFDRGEPLNLFIIAHGFATESGIQVYFLGEGTAFDRWSSGDPAEERLDQNRCCLVEITVYFSPNVKMNPAEARMLFWLWLSPVKGLGKRVST